MRKETNKREEKNYLVQKLDENVQYERILSWILLYLRLAYLIVGNGNEVFEILKPFFFNIRMRSNLAGRLSLI